MLVTILKLYLLTVALTLCTDVATTARSNYYGIDIKRGATLGAIICAAIPIANLIVAYDNLTMLLEQRDEFIVRFMYVKGRMDEVIFINDEKENEEGE